MKILFAALLLFSVAPSVFAQETPRADLFAGYSYLRSEEETESLADLGFSGTAARKAKDFNGWNMSVTGNFTNWFGIVADFGASYGTVDFDFAAGGSTANLRVRNELYTLMFGPQFSARGRNLGIFARVMAGAARRNQSIDILGGKVSEKNVGFAAAAGAGFDARLAAGVWVRVLQADYIITRFENDFGRKNQQHMRYSSGLLFRMGN